MDEPTVSPSGRYEVSVSPWEARMSLWVDTPTVSDTLHGAVLLAFVDGNWSLDEARWLSDHVVELRLRKYPGSHTPPQLVTTLDCKARTGQLGAETVPLNRLESALDRALTWPQPSAEPETGWRGFLRRIYRIWRGRR